MNIVRYRPLRGNLESWNWDKLLDNFFDDPVFSWDSGYPRVNVTEDEKGYTLEAELPGLSEKDLDIQVKDKALTISSQAKVEKEEKTDKQENFLIKERRSSSFSRRFVLPKNSDEENIKASFKNGLLTLHVPKIPEAQPRSIEVKAS